MAEVFYRIKGERGYADTCCGLKWREFAHDASCFSSREFAEVIADVVRRHDPSAPSSRKHDPTARVVKTTLRRAKRADAWCGNIRFDDYGDSKAHVFPRHRQWAYSICHSGHYWQDSEESFATEDEAKAAADAYLRKLGWVLA